MFKNIDLFGKQINLRFQKKQTYQSNFGSFITLLIVNFISYRFISILIDTIQGSIPQVNYSERQVDDPELFQTNSISYPIAFAMEDPITKNYYIDETIYTVSAQLQSKYLIYNQTQIQYNTVWEKKNITLQPCTVQNFKNPENQRYYLALNYTNMYCLPPKTNINIQGDFNSPVFQQIQFFVSKCQINCKSEEEINYYLMKSGLGLQLSDAYVDANQYENPFKIFSRDLYFSTSLLMPEDVLIYIRNNYVYSNKGLIQTATKMQKYPQFNLLSIMSEIGGLTQSFLAIGFLIQWDESCEQLEDASLKENKTIFNKKNEENSQNIQFDIASDKDKTFLSNASFIKLRKNKSLLCNDIQLIDQEKFHKNVNNDVKVKTLDNSRVSQKEIKDNTYSLSQNLEQKQFLNSILQNNNKSGEYLQRQMPTCQVQDKKKQEKQTGQKDEENYLKQKKKIDKNINKLLQKQTKSMEMSFWQYILSYICPFGRLKQKKEIIDYSIDKLYQNLDILQILKRLIEVEKLKRLLLDQDQIKLFDYLPKPTINFSLTSKKLQKQIQQQDFYKNQEINLLYQDDRSELQKIKDAYEAYKKILAKDDFSNLDQKIIDMIDKNIVDIFEVQQELNISDVQIPQQQSIYGQQLQDVFQNSPQSVQSQKVNKNNSTEIKQQIFPQSKTLINNQQQLNFQNYSQKLIQMQFQQDQITKKTNKNFDFIINDDQSSQGEIAKEDINNNLLNQTKDITFLNPFINKLKN
ncbi:small GTP-binding domain protein (macronuclear) [Tetrahymena thermophila SB210]|uniref:Small GTP-binding domain protein n=1 Tax=Tetrahymena thermophila (strain SB210) TaxID=312017 RepID=I7LUG7_TETTS|nr:small GTP-binding domain protein [Tetrahymena thermophila SB210]EAR93740.2 small GTP-binding domain protein [Tetrahymena thermophila SB210]|eukprot:XP_001013985.2 small GTP-binding domain protein [Tetrahymena thermophila SB210]